MTVHREQVARTGIVTIDRPQRRNAVDRPTAEALRAAIDDFDAAPDIDVIVLGGAGGTFCAGADLTAFNDPERRNALTPGLRGPMGPTRRHPDVPVIAAVEGHAVAGGFELALWADLRVVARDAVFGVSCRRVGVPLDDALLAEHRGGAAALEQRGADVGVRAFVTGAGRHGEAIDLAP